MVDLNRLRIPRTVFVALALAEVVVLFLLSDQPAKALPTQVPGAVGNVMHIFVHAVMAFLLLRALVPAGGGFLVASAWPGIRNPVAIPVLLLVLGHGVLDEIHQFFVEGRSCSVIDILSDVAGALLVLTFPYPKEAPGRPKTFVLFLGVLLVSVTLSIKGASHAPAFDSALEALMSWVFPRYGP